MRPRLENFTVRGYLISTGLDGPRSGVPAAERERPTNSRGAADQQPRVARAVGGGLGGRQGPPALAHVALARAQVTCNFGLYMALLAQFC